MAFTGYVFKTKKDVEKVAEIAGNGKTFEWCRTHALKLGCMVICGYVEKTNDNILYNSMMVISSSGELECNPRKHFLYETDKPWAASGEGFTSCYSPSLKRKISFGMSSLHLFFPRSAHTLFTSKII
jgi:protein N-terminal amidase